MMTSRLILLPTNLTLTKLAQVAETIKKRLRSCHEIIQPTAICRSCSRKLSGHKNRQTITDEVLNTTDRVQAIKDDVDIIQNSLQIIDQQKELIKEYQERP